MAHVSETAPAKIRELLVEKQEVDGGFTIKNAKSTCGCASSFSTE